MELKEIYHFLKENFKIDGENEKYATFYNDKNDVIGREKEMELDVFESKVGMNIDEVNFPIIEIDEATSVDIYVFVNKNKYYIFEFSNNFFVLILNIVYT